MVDNLAMAGQLAGQGARVGWYFALRMLADERSARTAKAPPVEIKGAVPTTRDLLADLGALMLDDALCVREGRYPASEQPNMPLWDYARRIRGMLEDIPRAAKQRQARDATTAQQVPGADALPEYFAQDFHFQDGGYLTEESARLYDVQVDTLFMGATALMRRAALKPIARYMAGRDQRQMSLLDVACGTGRALREYRLAYPAMKMTGIDLSQTYLDEAAKFLRGLRPVTFAKGNAEELPFDDASQDIVAMTYLFHELPGEVRRRVTGEIARVLKPGGLFVFIDSLQMGDRPEWDGMLEAFPARFHEPYFRGYAVDDLGQIFDDAGLKVESSRNAFLSKVMAMRKG